MRPQPTPYSEIEQAIKTVARAVGASKAILFESSARGTATRRSDVDVIFVQETRLRFLDRSGEPLRLLSRTMHGRGIDVLVYTPSEFEHMKAGGNAFVRRVIREGKVLYGA